MRFAAIKALYKAAVENKNLYFLSGDMGHLMVDEFKRDLGPRYMNTGIAEQNLIGMAAGLALSGKKVVVYSIIPFVTMRCFEQIKADVCYQNVDVTIIGVGGGLIYGPYGNTHCSIEDIAVMRVLPNMKVICPANPMDTEQLVGQALRIKGPTYIRIGRGKEPNPQKEYQTVIGKGQVLHEGTDMTVISTGTILPEAEKVTQDLVSKGISAELVHMHTVKPLDENLITDRMKKRKGIYTIEEHNIIGGLGSAVAEIIAEQASRKITFKRFGVRDRYLQEIGSQEHLREKHGISAETVVGEIIKLLKDKP